MRSILYSVIALLLAVPAHAAWNFDKHSIPLDQIRGGGPPKDGIPALDTPQFTTAREDSFLRPDDQVLGLAHKGVARAYPLRILSWHELVNDVIAGDPLLVSW